MMWLMTKQPLNTDSSFFKNPFDIDFSVNAKINVSNRPITVSKYRDITSNFESFSLYVNNLDTEFNVVDLEPTQSVTGGTLTITVKGKPFTSTTTTDTLIVKPNNLVTEKYFKMILMRLKITY
jgi:hypothetical protein